MLDGHGRLMYVYLGDCCANLHSSLVSPAQIWPQKSALFLADLFYSRPQLFMNKLLTSLFHLQSSDLGLQQRLERPKMQLYHFLLCSWVVHHPTTTNVPAVPSPWR